MASVLSGVDAWWIGRVQAAIIRRMPSRAARRAESLTGREPDA
jgi:hypothetical protein